MNNLTLKKLNSDLKFVYSDNNSISVIFQSNDLLMGVVGEFNSNLQELEKLTNTNLYFRMGGHRLDISNTNHNIVTFVDDNSNIISFKHLNLVKNFQFNFRIS